MNKSKIIAGAAAFFLPAAPAAYAEEPVHVSVYDPCLHAVCVYFVHLAQVVHMLSEVSGNYIDRYFGVHLAGGMHASGEGPYIQYDPEAGYYFMYVTYGGLAAEGGYNMRLFRSENPTGPYLDAAGNNAADNAEKLDNYGIKLIGNYSLFNGK